MVIPLEYSYFHSLKKQKNEQYSIFNGVAKAIPSKYNITQIFPASAYDIRKYTPSEKAIFTETPELFQKVTKYFSLEWFSLPHERRPYIDSIPLSRTEWIRNIFKTRLTQDTEVDEEGKDTEEVVILKESGEDGFVLVRDFKWSVLPPSSR